DCDGTPIVGARHAVPGPWDWTSGTGTGHGMPCPYNRGRFKQTVAPRLVRAWAGAVGAEAGGAGGGGEVDGVAVGDEGLDVAADGGGGNAQPARDSGHRAALQSLLFDKEGNTHLALGDGAGARRRLRERDGARAERDQPVGVARVGGEHRPRFRWRDRV